MTAISTCFFSQLLGKSVIDETGKALGKISDLAVAMDMARPKVAAIVIKQNGALHGVSFKGCSLEERAGGMAVICKEPEAAVLEMERTIFLKQRVLDRKLVDIQGRRMVKVVDFKMAFLGESAYITAVDVGFEGVLRRWRLDRMAKQAAKLLGSAIPVQLIPWDEVEAVDSEHAAIRIAKESSNLVRLHPADLADIIEDLDGPAQRELFASLDDEQAADVLEELETDAQISMIESLSVEKAADLLEKMPADEVADLLDELHESKAEELLNEMDMESSEDVRELMEYPDNTVGSLMSTDFVSFFENHTVGETIEQLRQMKPESDMIYYLYVVDSEERLVSTVSLRDIIISEPDVKLNQIMNKNIIFVQDMDRIDTLNEIIAKYSLLAVPVVDVNRRLLGMVVINDIVETLLKSRRKRL